MKKKELEILESEYQEELFKEIRDRRYWKYANIGAIIGFLFVLTSTSFESELQRQVLEERNEQGQQGEGASFLGGGGEERFG